MLSLLRISSIQEEHFHILLKLFRQESQIITLLDKPERRVIPVDLYMTGFQVPDRFVVGYGLDCAQKYRNLPYIGVIEG